MSRQKKSEYSGQSRKGQPDKFGVCALPKVPDRILPVDLHPERARLIIMNS